MKIAFISYEYPEETGGGGIGTYLKHILPALHRAGHIAIVISATNHVKSFWENEFVYRLRCEDSTNFNDLLIETFDHLHNEFKFDVVEGTDFRGWGLPIKEKFPGIPFVVKLHTPSYLVDLLQFQPLRGLAKFRYIVGGLFRGFVPSIKKGVNKENYSDEFRVLKLADRLAAPTMSIANTLYQIKMISHQNNVDHVPYHIPVNPEFKKIKARKNLTIPQIVFIGRHEKRKGVIELARAIPTVLKTFPFAHFTFVGGASKSPNSKYDMIEYLQILLLSHLDNVTFTGRVHHQVITDYLELGDIFVFPSHYESFGLVCTEAMAAGKAVIGSRNGGMVELLDNGHCGMLVSSISREISDAIIILLKDSKLRLTLGINGRKRVTDFYNNSEIVSRQISSYEKAISSLRNVN